MASPPPGGKTSLRIVCISDTHNDDCTDSLPDGDILIHSGDMTDDGTMEELQAAYNWISALPHKLKLVIAGNHEMGLDPSHPSFLPQAVDLFTSPAALASGLHYLARGVHPIPLPASLSSPDLKVLKVYANPHQPEFLGKPYAFIYPPHPSPQSAAAWADAPTSPEEASIWITHGPAQGRLDWIPLPPLTGCAVQAERIRKGRPVLTVFGHYHVSHGVEVVTWPSGDGGEEEEKRETLVKDGEEVAVLDFVSEQGGRRFGKGEKTVFVNAAWMTMKKPRDGQRYLPVVVEVGLEVVAD